MDVLVRSMDEVLEKTGRKGQKKGQHIFGAYKDKYGYFFTHPSWGNMGLATNDSPDHPQGVSQFSEYKEGPHLGKKIKFSDVPEHIQQHVIKRHTEKSISEGDLEKVEKSTKIEEVEKGLIFSIDQAYEELEKSKCPWKRGKKRELSVPEQHQLRIGKQWAEKGLTDEQYDAIEKSLQIIEKAKGYKLSGKTRHLRPPILLF